MDLIKNYNGSKSTLARKSSCCCSNPRDFDSKVVQHVFVRNRGGCPGGSCSVRLPAHLRMLQQWLVGLPCMLHWGQVWIEIPIAVRRGVIANILSWTHNQLAWIW